MKPLMHTWALWKALKNPPRGSPTFERTLQRQSTGRRAGTIATAVVGSVVLFYVVLSILTAQVFGSAQDIVAALALLIPLGILLFIFSGTAYGAIWTVQVSSNLRQAQQSGLYELLATTPGGSFGATWDIMMGSLYRDPVFERIPEAELPFPREVLWGILLVLSLMMITEIGRATFLPFTIFILISLAIYIDYVQSSVISALVGILSAQTQITRAETQTLALGGFLFVQITAYTIVATVTVFMLPAVYRALPEWVSNTTNGLPQLLVFYLVREPIIASLWHRIRTQFSTEELFDR